MPRGVWASAVLGLTAAGLAWAVVNLLPNLATLGGEYARLDQVTMWILGAAIGASALGGRALREGTSVALGAFSGLAIGGVAMLLAASVFAPLPIPVSPVWFIAFRALAWGGCGGLAALLLALWVQHRDGRAVAESMFTGGLGGALAGLVFALPGPSEVWQAAAFLLLGGVVGLAVAAPLLRRAIAVADRTPRRGPVPGILTLREAALYEGGAIALGAATLSCQGGRVALYPPPAGVVLNGHAIVAPVFLQRGGTLLVAEQRYRIQLCWPSR